jgi:hypothetical protein
MENTNRNWNRFEKKELKLELIRKTRIGIDSKNRNWNWNLNEIIRIGIGKSKKVNPQPHFSESPIHNFFFLGTTNTVNGRFTEM